jgi:hypothetical protein
MSRVVSLADARAARRRGESADDDPALIIDDALTDLELNIESAQRAISNENWPKAMRSLCAAADLLEAAMEAVP